jgi:hypothetical protein
MRGVRTGDKRSPFRGGAPCQILYLLQGKRRKKEGFRTIDEKTWMSQAKNPGF